MLDQDPSTVKLDVNLCSSGFFVIMLTNKLTESNDHTTFGDNRKLGRPQNTLSGQLYLVTCVGRQAMNIIM